MPKSALRESLSMKSTIGLTLLALAFLVVFAYGLTLSLSWISFFVFISGFLGINLASLLWFPKFTAFCISLVVVFVQKIRETFGKKEAQSW